jgi:hypothetical protein
MRTWIEELHNGSVRHWSTPAENPTAAGIGRLTAELS